VEQIKLPRLISQLSPDITHFPHFNVPVLLSRPYVVTIHDILMHKQKGMEATTLPLPVYYFKRLGYKAVFRKAVVGSKRIIVPSKYVKREIADYYKVPLEKIVVTYEGLDEQIRSSLPSYALYRRYHLRAPYFLYTGNAYPHKNLKRLIEAIVQLNHHSAKKVSLVIASARNVFTHRLEKVTAKLKAREYVRLLGFVPDDDLGTLYKNATAFVFPSISEGFGLTGLEAMAHGTLVIASDIAVFKEVYRDNAIYFNPFDYSSIVKAMEEVLEMESKDRQKIIAKAREFIKKYTWEKTAEETLRIYKQAAGGNIG
jgi:glycosyltransferase involved in cell wall biosynthesis